MASRQTPATAFGFLYRLFRYVLPIAREELRHWTTVAEQIPDDTLREQALASLKQKRFHADGGCVYAAVDLHHTTALTRLIVSLQTISDYLDNLCDRCDVYDMADFHQLHHAMRDAVVPDAPLRDYYQYRNTPDDGGYLTSLVQTCQREIATLPGYAAVQSQVTWLVERYSELQEHKHIDPSLRKAQLMAWWAPYEEKFPQLQWWEFAAATGSTLGMFALFLAATRPLRIEDAQDIYHSYFPWVCGLHILLDYLIDLDEDMAEGDFNFVRCYESPLRARSRIRIFARESLNQVRAIQVGGRIHRYVVKGLLGMYLSDDKVRRQRHVKPARRLIFEHGPLTWMFYGACLWYRVIR